MSKNWGFRWSDCPLRYFWLLPDCIKFLGQWFSFGQLYASQKFGIEIVTAYGILIDITENLLGGLRNG